MGIEAPGLGEDMTLYSRENRYELVALYYEWKKNNPDEYRAWKARFPGLAKRFDEGDILN